MGQFKGTPGKWNVCHVDERSNGWITIESDFDYSFRRLTCTIYGEHPEILGKLPETTLANALLISKAPEMLEMLKYLAIHAPSQIEYEKVQKLIKEATEL